MSRNRKPTTIAATIARFRASASAGQHSATSMQFVPADSPDGTPESKEYTEMLSKILENAGKEGGKDSD